MKSTAVKRARSTGSKPTLGKAKIVAFAATSDPATAKAFYHEKLGLKLISEDAFALVFDIGGIMLRVQRVEKVTLAPYTSLGWNVPDIRAQVRELAAVGIVFERYKGMPQDELGIWKSPAGAKVAWFKDPEGNTLSLTEF